MSSLVLDSLEIENFRTFRHLKIEKLGRVNLIVGKNNVGKTSLLEALKVYANGGTLRSVRQLLADRQESLSTSDWEDMTIKERLEALSHLFHGWGKISEYPDMVPPAIRLSSKPDTPTITLSVGWYKSVYDPTRSSASLTRLLPDEFDTITNPIPMFEAQIGASNEPLLYHLDEADRGLNRTPRGFPIPYKLVSTSPLHRFVVRDMWNEIVLSDQRLPLITVLRLIEPKIEAIELISESRGQKSRQDDMRTMVRLKDSPGFIPLQSLGEGVVRLFHIGLSLLTFKDGLLLIDEIENGFHYSVLPKIWRFIFEQADRLNVQVFATTHSWECIEAFQAAATENTEVEGILFNLRERYGEAGTIVAVDYDEENLEVATEQGIEVR